MADRLDYSEKEIEEMGEILLKADEINQNEPLARAVRNHLREKGQKMRKISDIRDRMEDDLEEDSQADNGDYDRDD
jgi:hypothetical protein